MATREPRFAFEDPAALAWTAQMFRTARHRRLLRLAAEQAAERDARADTETADRCRTAQVSGGGDG